MALYTKILSVYFKDLHGTRLEGGDQGSTEDDSVANTFCDTLRGLETGLAKAAAKLGQKAKPEGLFNTFCAKLGQKSKPEGLFNTFCATLRGIETGLAN